MPWKTSVTYYLYKTEPWPLLNSFTPWIPSKKSTGQLLKRNQSQQTIHSNCIPNRSNNMLLKLISNSSGFQKLALILLSLSLSLCISHTRTHTYLTMADSILVLYSPLCHYISWCLHYNASTPRQHPTRLYTQCTRFWLRYCSQHAHPPISIILNCLKSYLMAEVQEKWKRRWCGTPWHMKRRTRGPKVVYQNQQMVPGLFQNGVRSTWKEWKGESMSHFFLSQFSTREILCRWLTRKKIGCRYRYYFISWNSRFLDLHHHHPRIPRRNENGLESLRPLLTLLKMN